MQTSQHTFGRVRQLKARWASDRRLRLLLNVVVAVVLPAAALVYVNFYHVKSVERDKVLEAAIQRDFQQMLVIAEKQINEKMTAMAADAQRAFPAAGTPEPQRSERLDAVLRDRPWIDHVFLFQRGPGLVVRSQPQRLADPEFQDQRGRFSRTLDTWLLSESKDFIGEMRKKGLQAMLFTEPKAGGNGRVPFATTAFFPVASGSEGGEALGGLRFDVEYLSDTFFPSVLDELVAYRMGEEGTTPLAMSVTRAAANPGHFSSTASGPSAERILAASSGWGAGPAEVSRNLEDTFRGLALGIKFQGVSAATLGRNWALRGFVTLALLSLLLTGGLALAYRGISQELAFSRLQSDFVSNVSHELRTPLSLIRLYAETLELGRVTMPDRIQEYYSTIRTESEKLTGLIDNILDFSRLEAGRKEYDLRLENLGDLVRDTVETYRAQLDEHGFELVVSIEPNLPDVRIDRESIARSLVNLMNNALKYSDRDKFLGVRLYRSADAVRLEVVDHGIGIARGDQAKIFEKFYRAGDALVHHTKGSGLGLSLVRHTARAHGGTIQVDSAPGRGSTFTLALPVAVANADQHPAPHEG